MLIKERLDLPPNLRELDELVEQVELQLREIVGKGLRCDTSQLPPHVLQKIDERVQRALKKNAALDAEYFQTMQGKLEYCDLRELQDVITAKTLWPEPMPTVLSGALQMSRGALVRDSGSTDWDIRDVRWPLGFVLSEIAGRFAHAPNLASIRALKAVST